MSDLQSVSKIPAHVFLDIEEQIENLNAVIYAFLTAAETNLLSESDELDDNLPAKGHALMKIKKKALMLSFGRIIQEEFSLLNHHYEALKKFTNIP